MSNSQVQYSIIIRLLNTRPRSRTDEQIRQLMELTQGIKFFSSLSKAVHEDCCRVMTCLEYSANQTVFSFGDQSDSFCVILKGSVGVGVPNWTTMLANKLVRLPTTGPAEHVPERGQRRMGSLPQLLSQNRSKTMISRVRPSSPMAQLAPDLAEVTVLSVGSSFGELGLLRGEKRAATITCKEPTTLAILTKTDFDTILRENQAKLLNDKISFLLSIPIFSQWSQTMMSKGSYYFNERNYIKGEFVYREGDAAGEVYIVVEGEFMVGDSQFSKVAKSTYGHNTERATEWCPQVHLFIKGRKEMFGDTEVVEDTCRETTCRCHSKTAHVLVASKTVRCT